MKCKNCGAELSWDGEAYLCAHCESRFAKEEFAKEKPIVQVVVTDVRQNNDFVIRGGVLVSYTGSDSIVVIPRGVVTIGAGAFRGNVGVQKVVFSETVKTVDKNAFEGCTQLTEIENYQSVEIFGDESFKFAGLKSVIIGKNVVQLGKYCFSAMPNLERVEYEPDKNLKLIKTFASCPKLTDVEMDKWYFFPSFHGYLEVKNNPQNERYTYFDAFYNTPFLQTVKKTLFDSYEKGICPECGGVIHKGLFHAKCKNCGIDYKN